MAAEDYHDMNQLFDFDYKAQFDDSKRCQTEDKRRKQMKLKNKFYVASDSVIDGHARSNWRKATLKDAVKHAQSLMSATGYNNVKYIVKIVAVVKQEKPPVSVEKVE